MVMLACVAMCLAGPVAAWLGVLTGVNAMSLVNLSPLMSVRTLGDGTSIHPTDLQWRLIAVLGVAAIAAWAALLIIRSSRITNETSADPTAPVIDDLIPADSPSGG